MGSAMKTYFLKKAPWQKNNFQPKKKKKKKPCSLVFWNLSYQNPKLGEMTAKLRHLHF